MAKDKSTPSDEGEFKLPVADFDEKGFIKKELEGARATFVAAIVGLLAGVAAFAVSEAAVRFWTPRGYLLGWVVIAIGLGVTGRVLERVGFSEDATGWKSLLGQWFLVFFTALGVWILAANVF